MRRFKLARAAAADIREIRDYIAKGSVDGAKESRLRLLAECSRIGDNPGIRHTRKDLTDLPLLFWPVGEHLILYRSERNPVEIVCRRER